jgi:hypothetical protein
VSLGGFLAGASLPDFNSDAGPAGGTPWLVLGDALPLPEGPAHVLLSGGLAFAGEGACRDCFALAARTLEGAPFADPVTLGSLAALTAQRLVLGWSEPLGLVSLAGGLPRTLEVPRCARHA